MPVLFNNQRRKRTIMKRLVLGFCVLSVSLLISCNSWIDSGLNTDPTSPKDGSFAVVLPTTQVGMAYVLGGDLGRYTSLITQHNVGVDRQHLGIYQYVIKENDLDNAWRFNLYGGPMNDLYILMKKADDTKSPHYKGICQVMMAHAVGTVTDLWGDVPYSKAFEGSDAISPGYDTQEAIYTSIAAMLADAIANLNAASSTFKPGSDDRIYGGDLAKWKMAANALAARYAIHVIKRNPAAGAVALSAVAGAFASNADDMQFAFGSVETQANPWYQFTTQRAGDLNFGETLSTLMNGLSDPRRPFYAVVDDSGTYSGLSQMGPLYASINSPIPFITYTEVKFIEAEAQFRAGNMTEAHAAYVAAVTASLERSGVAAADVTAYLAQASVDGGAAGLTLDRIMTQKYIAMYSQCESWVDWRRTGSPALTPVTGSVIPRRFPYAQSERLYNAANYKAGVTIFERVWWDVP